MNCKYNSYIRFSLIVLIIFNYQTCNLSKIQNDNTRELRNFNFEVKTGNGYEKTLSDPKMTAYLITSREKIAEIVNDPNNIPPTGHGSKLNEELIQNNTFAFYCNIEDLNKKVVSISLNDNEPIYGFGFRYDQIKVKMNTGGYPGRGSL